MITNLEELGFLSYDHLTRMFKFNGLILEHQGQYKIKLRLVDIDFYTFETEFKLQIVFVTPAFKPPTAEP